MDLNNSLLSDPVIFCPSIFINEEYIDELKNIITKDIKDLSDRSIDDKVLSDEVKTKVRSFIKIKIGLKPLTVIEIVRI